MRVEANDRAADRSFIHRERLASSPDRLRLSANRDLRNLSAHRGPAERAVWRRVRMPYAIPLKGGRVANEGMRRRLLEKTCQAAGRKPTARDADWNAWPCRHGLAMTTSLVLHTEAVCRHAGAMRSQTRRPNHDASHQGADQSSTTDAAEALFDPSATGHGSSLCCSTSINFGCGQAVIRT